MNKERRKAIHALMADCEQAKEQDVEGQISAASDIGAAVDSIKDDEQEYLDNMPEGLQQGDKASAAQDAIDALGDACQMLTEFEEENYDGERDWDDVVSRLDEATT